MGVILALLSAVFATSKDLASKKLAFALSGSTSTLASFVFALPFYFVLLLALWIAGIESFNITLVFIELVILRSLSDACAEWCKMSALKEGDISLVIPVFAMSPIILIFIAPLITGDKIDTAGVIGLILTVAGSLVLLDSLGSVKNLRASLRKESKAVMLGLLGAFFFALNSCFDRLAVHQASPVLSGFAVTLGAAIFVLPVVLRDTNAMLEISGDHANPSKIIQNIKVLITRGALELLFMVAKLSALVFLETHYVVGLQRFSVVLSIVIGGRLFKERHLRKRIIAGLLIVAGTLVLVLSKSL